MLQLAGFKTINIFPAGGYFTTKALKSNYFWNRFITRNNFISFFMKLFLYPMFYINQWLAPLLDKLDKNKLHEASGYWVIAQKITN